MSYSHVTFIQYTFTSTFEKGLPARCLHTRGDHRRRQGRGRGRHLHRFPMNLLLVAWKLELLLPPRKELDLGKGEVSFDLHESMLHNVRRRRTPCRPN